MNRALRPPQTHIDQALKVEAQARKNGDMGRYLECLNGVPMSKRRTDQDLRDGCILTHQVYAVIAAAQEANNDE